MTQNPYLHKEINQMKKLLEATAKRNKYNLRHPEVLTISQKLDDLILETMRERYFSISK
jgi:hypothetical protein